MIQSVIQILIADNAFKAAIGLNKAGNRYKVYPVVADQDEEPPYCVVYMSSSVPNSRCSEETAIEVIMCAKPSITGAYDKITTLENLAKEALEAHSGTEAVTGNTLTLMLANRRDGYDKEANVMQRITTYTVVIDV